MQDRSDTAARIPVDRGDLDAARDRNASQNTGDARDVPAAKTSPAPATATRAAAANTAAPVTTATATVDAELLPRDVLDDFRARWEKIQVGFVDQPQQSVQAAHDLVDQLVDCLSQSFTRQREGLEGSWSRGEADTEALRKSLQQYRSFFNRLLAT